MDKLKPGDLIPEPIVDEDQVGDNSLDLQNCKFCFKAPETGITGAPECDNWRYVKCSNEYCPLRHVLFTVDSWNKGWQGVKLEKEQLLADVLSIAQGEMGTRPRSSIHRKACDAISEKVIALCDKVGLNKDHVFTLFLDKQGKTNLSKYIHKSIEKKKGVFDAEPELETKVM